MKAFISAGVTGFHRWKRLLGLRPPWRSNTAILSEAYLHFEHSVVPLLALPLPLLTLPLPLLPPPPLSPPCCVLCPLLRLAGSRLCDLDRTSRDGDGGGDSDAAGDGESGGDGDNDGDGISISSSSYGSGSGKFSSSSMSSSPSESNSLQISPIASSAVYLAIYCMTVKQFFWALYVSGATAAERHCLTRLSVRCA